MTASCACGSVELEAFGAPVACIVCYCDDCQQGSREIEALPGAGPVQDPDNGTAYVIYRKDRVKCPKGSSLLKRYKIREKSATNRVVATCCNSAMYIDYDDGKHWVDVYRSRFGGHVPPLQMRIYTKFKSGNDAMPSDVPTYPALSLKFIAKLMAARAAMLLYR